MRSVDYISIGKCINFFRIVIYDNAPKSIQYATKSGDIASYLEHVEDVTLDLQDLHDQIGKHTRKMITALTVGDLKDWAKKSDYVGDDVSINP